MYTSVYVSLTADSLPQSEILRYMRAGSHPSDEVMAAAERGAQAVLEAVAGRGCYACLPVHSDGDCVRIGELDMKSKSLARHLEGCGIAFVIAVTAGVGVDRKIRAAEAEGVLIGLATDAAGSALVEVLCDSLCDHICGEICQNGEYAMGVSLTKRFSAGYGDLSLEYQRDICELLDMPRSIGATLTDGGMLAPTKTVTAIVGVKSICDA